MGGRGARAVLGDRQGNGWGHNERCAVLELSTLKCSPLSSWGAAAKDLVSQPREILRCDFRMTVIKMLRMTNRNNG